MTPYERSVEFEARMQLTAAIDQNIAPMLDMADRLEHDVDQLIELHPALGSGANMLIGALRGYTDLLHGVPEYLRRRAEARHAADIEAGTDLEP